MGIMEQLQIYRAAYQYRLVQTKDYGWLRCFQVEHWRGEWVVWCCGPNPASVPNDAARFITLRVHHIIDSKEEE